MLSIIEFYNIVASCNSKTNDESEAFLLTKEKTTDEGFKKQTAAYWHMYYIPMKFSLLTSCD